MYTSNKYNIKTKYTEFPRLYTVINRVHSSNLSYNQVYKFRYGFINTDNNCAKGTHRSGNKPWNAAST